MKGVMMIINLFPPYGGGTERQAERLSAYLAHRNVFAGFITRKLDGSPFVESRGGVQIIRIQEFGPGRLKSLSFILGSIYYMVRYANSFDVLHAHLAFAPAISASMMGRLLGKRVIVKFGNSGTFGDVQELNRTWRGHLSLAMMRRWVDLFIALTEEIKMEMLEAGFSRERIVRMVNGVDTALFRPPADKQDSKNSLHLTGSTVLLFTGRLTAQKGLPNLLLALRQVVAVQSNVHLLLAGEGEERQRLEALASELGLESHLTFLGRCDSVQSYLNVADIFVLPSLSEGISNSLLEAMASGLPCIATNVGGSVEALGGGACGILISPNSVEQLANAIIKSNLESCRDETPGDTSPRACC